MVVLRMLKKPGASGVAQRTRRKVPRQPASMASLMNGL